MEGFAVLITLFINNLKLNMKINIGISKEHLQKASEKLNVLLADETVLYIKTRGYHWNVEGSEFAMLHQFFENQYKELENIIDAVAERVRKLGHYSVAKMDEYIKMTNLVEQEMTSEPKKQLTQLLEDHETIIKELRKLIPVMEDDYEDAGTADFLTGLMEQHEEMAWMLRAHLN